MNLTGIPMIQHMLSKTPLEMNSSQFRQCVEKIGIINGHDIDSTNFMLLMRSDEFDLDPLETWETNLQRALRVILNKYA